jgi:DNA-binding LytR/AlgR family response regulator
MKGIENRSIYYPDIWIFIIAIPLINAINYYLTYSDIHLNFFLVITFAIDTVQGYLAWLAVRKIIIYLDKRFPYAPNLMKRIVVQLITTTATGLFIIALTTELISWIARNKPAPADFYAMDLLIIGIWFFVINGVYIGIYFYRQWKKAELDKNSNRTENGSLHVRFGNQNILVKFADILLFCIDGDYVQLIQKNGKTFYCDQSLDKLERILPKNTFFRINRQFIMNRQAISGIKRIENGKLLVLPAQSVDNAMELIVSRTKARTFKEWLLPL